MSIAAIGFLSSLMVFTLAGGNHTFRPGEVWLDVQGNPIQAHAGGVLHHEGAYYWFGQNLGGKTWLPEDATWERYRVDVIGVSCYSSTDLYNWTNQGIALAPVREEGHDLHPSRVVERPKVIYNQQTRKFVMWMHVDSADYLYARAGVAVADRPQGPYRYLGSIRPEGKMARDLTLFRDFDGRAYLIYASENNATIYISLLSEDYLKTSGTFVRAFKDQSREAPAVFRRGDHYFFISSACTGWDPNPAQYAVAKSMLGPWEVRGNPAEGVDADTTFHSQSTFVLPVAGKQDAFIFLADRWKKTDLGASAYIWLPIEFDGDRLRIRWLNEWDLSRFAPQK